MQGFSNQSISPPRTHKPHIVYRDGWWRVSIMKRPWIFERSQLWASAHAFVGKLHAQRT